MTPINNSTHVTKVGVHENDLLVEFKSGTMYCYYGAANHYANIIALGPEESVGRYIVQHLKKTRTPFDKLEKIIPES